MIPFISFSDKDFRYVSRAFLKATMVAVTSVFGTGDVGMGDDVRSPREID